MQVTHKSGCMRGKCASLAYESRGVREADQQYDFQILVDLGVHASSTKVKELHRAEDLGKVTERKWFIRKSDPATFNQFKKRLKSGKEKRITTQFRESRNIIENCCTFQCKRSCCRFDNSSCRGSTELLLAKFFRGQKRDVHLGNYQLDEH